MQMIHNNVSDVKVLIEIDNNLYTFIFHIDIKMKLFTSKKHEVLVKVEQKCAELFCLIKIVQLAAQSLLQNINLQSN